MTPRALPHQDPEVLSIAWFMGAPLDIVAGILIFINTLVLFVQLQWRPPHCGKRAFESDGQYRCLNPSATCTEDPFRTAPSAFRRALSPLGHAARAPPRQGYEARVVLKLEEPGSAPRKGSETSPCRFPSRTVSQHDPFTHRVVCGNNAF